MGPQVGHHDKLSTLPSGTGGKGLSLPHHSQLLTPVTEELGAREGAAAALLQLQLLEFLIFRPA